VVEYYAEEMLTADNEAPGERFQVERLDPTPVRDVMTPAVFAVGPEASSARCSR
jgi:hypothetical protein